MRLIRGIDVIALVQRLDVQNLTVFDIQFAVTHNILNLESRNRKSLPHTRLPQQTAHLVSRKQRLRRGFGARDDELSRRE